MGPAAAAVAGRECFQDWADGAGAFHRNFFLLLNFAIGGDWPGFAVDESRLPAKMYVVDYVRVYADDPGQG
ncbi:MAG: hypothetical protein QM601_11035 [Pseudoxanthomonas sp.]